MGRLNKKINKKLFIIFMLLVTLIIGIFTKKVFAQRVVRSVSDRTGNYPIPRYITYEQYINDPYLLCTGHGIALPGYNSTWVISGDYKTHTTDQNKDTGYLTANDLLAATCFADGTLKDLVDTESKTYGYFTSKTVHEATPAEAYVLAELNNNTPGNGVDFRETNEEYTGEVDESAYVQIDEDTKYYLVEYDDSNLALDPSDAPKYVVKKGEKYYVVEATNDGGQGNYSAVQVAWWALSVAQEGSRSGGNSLTDEASAFQDYIESISDGEVRRVEGDEVESDSIETLTFNQSEINLSVGGKATLTYGAFPSDVRRQAIVWKTSDEKIATVDSKGKVKGVKKGKALITLYLKDNPEVKATCVIIVGNVDASDSDDEDDTEKILLDRKELVMQKGKKATVEITLIPSDMEYEVKVNKKAYVEIEGEKDDNGDTVIKNGKLVLKAKKVTENQTITVTVKSKKNSSVKKTINVKVVESASEVGKVDVYRMEANRKSLSLVKGETATLSATVYPADATNKKYSFTSSDTSVATVNSNGIVKAKAKGKAEITMTSKDNSNVKAKCKVTVLNEKGEDISYKNPKETESEYLGQVTKRYIFDVKYQPTHTSKDAKVLFDATTNKYKIGPFSTHYVRNAGQFGSRPVVDFAGITSSVLTGKFYEDGQEVEKDIPKENYRIVYDHDHKAYMEAHKQGCVQGSYSDEDYEFPYSDETFYIELDYLKGLSAISRFNFNYHYMNGGGTYTVLHGKYLKIKWKVHTSYIGASGMATSNNDEVEFANLTGNMFSGVDLEKINGTSGAEVNVDTTDLEFESKGYLSYIGGSTFDARDGIAYEKLSKAEDYIYFTYKTPSHNPPGPFNDHTGKLEITSVSGSQAEIVQHYSGRLIRVRIKRNFSKLVQPINIVITYKCTECDEVFTDTVTGSYSNNWHDEHVKKYLAECGLKLKTESYGADIKNNENTYEISRSGFIGGKGEGTQIVAEANETPTVSVEDGMGSYSGNKWTIKKSPINGKLLVKFESDFDGEKVSVTVKVPVKVKKPFAKQTRIGINGNQTKTIELYNLSGSSIATDKCLTPSTCNFSGLDATFETSTGLLATTYLKGRSSYRVNGFFKGLKFVGDSLSHTMSADITVTLKDSNNNRIVVHVEYQGTSTPEVVDPPAGENENPSNENTTNENTANENTANGNTTNENTTNENTTNENSTDTNQTNPGSTDSESETVFDGGEGDSGAGTATDNKLVPDSATANKAQPQTVPGGQGDDDTGSTDADTELGTGAAYLIDEELSEPFLGTEDDKKPELDLTTSIGGMVWEDFENFAKGEDTSANGVYKESDGDKKLSKIEVRIWRVVYEKNGDTYTESTSEEYKRTLADAYRTKTVDEKGSVKLENKINFESDKVEDRLFTDDKGDYVAYLTVPAIEGLDTDKYKVSYDVEFIYDGQTYEVTEYLASTLTEEEKEKKKEAKTVEEKVEEFKKTSAIPDGAGADPSTIDYSKYANDSYAIETYTERHDFDASFTQIKGDKEIQSDGTTKGKAEDASANVKELDYTSEDQKFDPDPTGEADATNNGNDESRKASTLVTKNQDGYVKDEFKMKARTSTAGLLLPYEDRIHIEKMKETIPLEYVDTQQEGTFTYYKPVTEYFSHINLGLVTRDTTDVSVTHDLYKAAVTVNNDELTYKYSSLKDYENKNYADTLNMLLDMQNSGVEYELGLYASDFYYRADVYKPETNAEVIKKSIYDEKKNSELRVFATYRFSVYNDSTTQDMSINRLTDYFDDSFTPVQSEIKAKVNNADGISEESVVAEPSYYRIYNMMASINTTTAPYKYNKAEDTSIETLNRSNNEPITVGTVTWQVDDTFNKELTKLDGTEEAGKYKKMYTDTFTAKNENGAYTKNELTLHPGEKIEIFVTFEVDNKGYLDATEPRENEEDSLYRGNLLGGKNNVVEVSNYTTFYTDSSLGKNNNVAYKSGEVSGRIDKDSAPDNTNFDMTAVEENNGVKYTVLDKKWFEDDTDSAPVFKIFLRNPADNPRTLDGVVWEDELNKDVDGALNTKTGDGKYEDSEKKIEGVTVSLVEKIKIKDDDGNINEYEYVWPDNAFGTPSDTNAVPSYTSVLMTDKDGGYKFSNFVAGDYVVRFEYGNTALTMKYNGQDYKNTAYQTNIKNPTKEEITDKYKEVNEVGEEIIHYEKMNNDQYVDGSGINEELADQITVNNEWHDLTDLTKNLNTERVSDARDYEARRLDVIKNSRTISNRIAEILALADSDEAEELITKVKEKMNTENITYGEALTEVINASGNEKLKELVNSDEYKALIELNSMEANTAKLNVEVETAGKVDYGKSKKSVNGTFTVATGGSYEKIKETWTNDEENSKKEYNIKNIDFGIERRANTIIQLDKYVEQIDITKQNEKVFSVGVNEDGTLKTEDAIRLDKVISVSESDGVQGFKYINMEDSYLQNSTVAIKYKIRVTNKSEADFASEELVKTYTADKIKEKVDSIYEADSTKSGENIKYGQYVGLYYYTHDKQAVGEEKHIASADYKDANVKTRVDRLVEYIDPNSSGLDEATTNSEDSAWETSLPTDVADADKDADGNAVVKGERIKALKGLISDESYTNTAEEGKADEYYLADDDGRIYITETRNLVEFSHSDKIVEKVIETNRLDRGNKGEGQLTYQDTEKPKEKRYITVGSGTLTIPEVFKVNDVFVYDNNNGDEYVTDAFDKKLTQELDTIALTDDKVKDDEDAIIHVTIKNDVANDISLENMIYYNLAEVLVYSNSVGRRSMSAIPGNAFEYAKQEVKQDDDRMMYASGIWEAAHSSNMNTNDEIKDKIKNEIPADKDTNNLKKTMKYAINTNKAMNEYNKNKNGYTVYTIAELDADSTDFVTFTEPTGLSQAVQQQNIIIIALLIALVLLAVGIIAITVRVVLRKSTDDIVIESTKEE